LTLMPTMLRLLVAVVAAMKGAMVLASSQIHEILMSHTGTNLQALIDEHYPSQYVALKLEPKEKITIDGHLDENAWQNISWLDNFMDLAGPRFQGKGAKTWEDASREYQALFTGSSNPTRVKIRWSSQYLYVGAELESRHVCATVTGHCDALESSVWKDTPVLPYFDDDFEVFVDASMDNYFYVEYEVSARNASYSTLWSLPQAGLGSVAPECGGGGGARNVCFNSTWNGGKGLCDHGVEHEQGTWTLEMYDVGARPSTGLLSATANGTDRWTLEIRFPILSTSDHGGLINLEQGSFYPGSDPGSLDPNRGQKFWWATFANALHAPWWSTLNKTTTKQPKYIESLCQEVLDADKSRNGFTQFLVDANNAAPTCYYEAASQHLGGHQYMHNPDNYGYLQFADVSAVNTTKMCRNIQWLSRFVLAQIYQAEVQYLVNVSLGNGAFTPSLEKLLSPNVCTIENACNATALRYLTEVLDVNISADESRRIGNCVRYAVSNSQTSDWTGGPCFNATVSYMVQNRANASQTRKIVGTINEARYISSPHNMGQRVDEEGADWLCLDSVVIM